MQTRLRPQESAVKIGSTVEKELEATLWRLVAGEIRLQDLTPALMGYYAIGHADGVTLMAVQLEQCAADRDRYYRAAFSPREPIRSSESYAERERIRARIYAGGAS